jgi:hypothetical protein
MKEFIPKTSLSVDISKIIEESLVTPLDLPPDSGFFSPIIDFLQLKRYDELNGYFFKDGVNHSRQRLIKGLATQIKTILNKNIKAVYTKLNFVANLYLFNEFEVVYWSILLINTINSISEYQKSALFAGYLTKMSLNSDILPFEAYLSTLYLNFKMDFSNWQLICDFPSDVNIKEANSRYVELMNTNEKKNMDYEGMVELLMPIPRRKMSAISESHVSDISINDKDVIMVLEEYEGLVFDAIDQAED